MIKKYRKKPVVIDAIQWFENGDHPEDCSQDIDDLVGRPVSTLTYKTEGKIVRYFRSPDLAGSTVCSKCGRSMHDHGWIDTLEDGHNVCPGDYIIKGIKGEFYPCKPDIFEMTYEEVK